MTPALTKIFKDGCGIHACASSVRMDSEGKAALNSMDDGHLQTLLPLLSSLPPQSSLLPMGVLASPVFSLSQDQVVLLPCSSPPLSLLSVSEDAVRSQQDASVFPGGSDMFEHNCQEACLLYGRSPSLTHGPGGGDVPRVPLLHRAPPVYPQAETKRPGRPPAAVPWSACIREDAGPMGCLSPPSPQPFANALASDQPRVRLTEALRPRLDRQAGLQSKAQRLEKRLRLLLGEHAAQHCTQQLAGLEKQLDVAAQRRDFALSHSGLDSSCLAELGEFTQSNQAVLRRLQGALDSEATLSSSSDEEHEGAHACPRPPDL